MEKAQMNSLSKFFRTSIVATAVALSLAGVLSHPAAAADKPHFKLAWSIYVGWMPWQWANEHGIVKKWADKYGITLDVVQFNDYSESINQYTAGAYDALTITNMDTLAVPAPGGVDSTAVIVGDFSNGNDAVILKDKTSLSDIKGQTVNLVQYSVSQYLLARALESVGMTERDVTIANLSDADMEAAYKTPAVSAVVTWNPIVADILAGPNAHEVFDSSKIPGEIMDLAIVNTKTLTAHPELGKALAGIWYETLGIMSQNNAEGQAARAAMGKASGTDLAGFDGQLKTTRLFVSPTDAVNFTRSADMPSIMDKVRTFLFAHKLLGDNAPNADVIGIKFDDGTVHGDPNNIKFRFTADYMKMAADGKL